MPEGFQLRRLHPEFDAALANHHGLLLHEPEGRRIAPLRPRPRDLVQRIVQPLPFAGDFLLARQQRFKALPVGYGGGSP